MLKDRGSYSDGVVFNRTRTVVPGLQPTLHVFRTAESVISCPRASTQRSMFTGGDFEVDITLVIILPKSEILYSHFAVSH